MIARIRRVWPGDIRTTVIAIDEADRREKTCYVWTNTAKGQLLASVCAVAEGNGGGLSDQRVVLQVAPPIRRWGYEIEEAELMPLTPQQASHAS